MCFDVDAAAGQEENWKWTKRICGCVCLAREGVDRCWVDCLLGLFNLANMFGFSILH